MNAILVKGTRDIAEALAARSDVARVEGNPLVHINLPEPGSAVQSSPQVRRPATIALLVTLFLVGFLWPAAAVWVGGNLAFNLGMCFGTVAILLAPLSNKSRADFRADFDCSYGHFYTRVSPEAHSALGEPIKNEEQQLQDYLFDFTIIGADHMAKGIIEFSAWSKAMLSEEHSESLRPFLRTVYANSKTMLETTKKHFPE